MKFRVMEEMSDPSYDKPYLLAGMDRNWEKRMEFLGDMVAELLADALKE